MNLENLFKWNNELVIKNSDGTPAKISNKSVILYQRIIGDAELGRSRKSALKSSRRLRASLRDKTTDEHISLIPEYDTLTIDELRNSVILAEGFQIRREATEAASPPKLPKSPKSNATLEEQENYETSMDDYNKKLSKAIDAKTKEIMERRSKELEGVDKDTLSTKFVNAAIDSLCQAEMLRIFNFWCAYFGTYKDKAMRTRAFKSFDSFDNTSTQLKDQIIGGYVLLQLNGEDLKN